MRTRRHSRKQEKQPVGQATAQVVVNAVSSCDRFAVEVRIACWIELCSLAVAFELAFDGELSGWTGNSKTAFTMSQRTALLCPRP